MIYLKLENLIRDIRNRSSVPMAYQLLLEKHYIQHVSFIQTAWLILSLGVCTFYIFECMVSAIEIQLAYNEI